MRRLVFALFVATWVVALRPVAGQLVPYGGASEYVEDLGARRAATASSLGPDSVLLLWSATPKVYSTDTDYEYRQESNLLYLTGLDDQPVTLALVPGAIGANAFLFVPARDPFRELWYGPIASTEDIARRTGIAHVFSQRRTEAFDAFMRGLLGLSGTGATTDAEAAGIAAFAGDQRPLRLAWLDTPAPADPPPPMVAPDVARRMAWARDLVARRPGLTFHDAEALLTGQRQVKTPYEQRVMRRSVEISAEAHIAGMKATRPGRWEYEVEAAIEHWFLANGAMSWGYPSIVASGPNATVLHYLKSTRRMAAGDLLLVDAAASFQGLTGDITRTWPVSGRFTADQRTLYNIVLRAQEAGIAAARPGGTAQEITRAVRAEIGKGLLAVGLVTDPAASAGTSPQIDLWFPHGPVHGIGMDVHESLGRLVSGVTFVVEPGIYVRQDTLDRLAATASQAELVRAISPAVKRFLNVGIRIEDSLLMGANGVEVLSAKVPKQAAAVERLVGR